LPTVSTSRIRAASSAGTSGITRQRYDGMPQDEKGIMRGKVAGHGPDIAWFTDPAGNILSVLSA
jgi:hypothetical protein